MVGCFIGMGLPALLTIQFIPPGTNVGGMGVAVRQAEGIAASMGGLATAGGTILWYLTLLTGFWILFSTQLGIMDFIPRSLTDLLWTSNPRVRAWAGGDIRKVYYTILVVFVVWGCIAINLAQPFILILLGAFAAGFIMTVASIHVWYINRKFLPKEYQAPAWRQALLWAMALFYGFFTVVVILDRVFGVRL
jgi:hypothetical protein